MANLPDLTLAPWQSCLRPETLAALRAMSKEQPVAGSTPDGELSILVERLNARKARNVLQLGTFLGWSALIIADQIKPRGGTLVTVDPSEHYLGICRRYAAAAGLGNVLTLAGQSQDEKLAGDFKSMGWDAIYIDTTHHYAQTRRELELYAGEVAGPLTTIFLHDASEYARQLDVEGRGGVKAAILEWLAEHKQWQGEICEPPKYPEAEFGLGVLWQR